MDQSKEGTSNIGVVRDVTGNRRPGLKRAIDNIETKPVDWDKRKNLRREEVVDTEELEVILNDLLENPAEDSDDAVWSIEEMDSDEADNMVKRRDHITKLLAMPRGRKNKKGEVDALDRSVAKEEADFKIQSVMEGRDLRTEDEEGRTKLSNVHYTISRDNTDEEKRKADILREFGKKNGGSG